MILYAWLVGAWIATLWFFTFGVARVLFAAFPRDRAGDITTALFPAYFLAAVTLGVLACGALWFRYRGARDFWPLALQVLALAALVAIPLLIQPAIIQHAPGSPDWARWHGISMGLNLFSLIAVPAASLLVLARRKE